MKRCDWGERERMCDWGKSGAHCICGKVEKECMACVKVNLVRVVSVRYT